MRTAAVAALLTLLLVGRANAAVVIGSGDTPSVAVGADGTAYVVWNGSDANDPPTYCRLPRGATACDVALTLPVPSITNSSSLPVISVNGTRVTVVAERYGQLVGLFRWTSTNGGVSFGSYTQAGPGVPIHDAVVGPGDTLSVVTDAVSQGELFANVPLGAGSTSTFANLSATKPYYGTVGLTTAAGPPFVVYEDASSLGEFRRYSGTGDVNTASSWTAPVEIGYASYPRLAGGPAGLIMLGGDESGGLFTRKYDGAGFEARVPVTASGDSSEMALFQDAGGWLHALYPSLDGTGYHAIHAVSDDGGATWRTTELDVRASQEQSTMRGAAAGDHVGLAVWSLSGQIIASAIGPDSAVAPPSPIRRHAAAGGHAPAGAGSGSLSSRSAARSGCG